MKHRLTETRLSILAGLADCDGLGMHDYPADESDPAFSEICTACIADIFDGLMVGEPYCREAGAWCANMRGATPDDVAELLG